MTICLGPRELLNRRDRTLNAAFATSSQCSHVRLVLFVLLFARRFCDAVSARRMATGQIEGDQAVE